jgi:hypothetical protein
MKRALAFITFGLLFLGVWANCTSAAASTKTTDPIQSIRSQYAAINRKAARLKKVKKELSGFSAEGGELVAYFDGAAIPKIVATYYGEMGRTIEEYYFGNGKLIFVFWKVFHYDRPLSGKVVRTEESRFYFVNDQLIRWLDENEKQVPSSTPEFQEQQKDYIETSAKFTSGARSRARVIEA